MVRRAVAKYLLQIPQGSYQTHPHHSGEAAQRNFYPASQRRKRSGAIADTRVTSSPQSSNDIINMLDNSFFFSNLLITKYIHLKKKIYIYSYLMEKDRNTKTT